MAKTTQLRTFSKCGELGARLAEPPLGTMPEAFPVETPKGESHDTQNAPLEIPMRVSTSTLATSKFPRIVSVSKLAISTATQRPSRESGRGSAGPEWFAITDFDTLEELNTFAAQDRF